MKEIIFEFVNQYAVWGILIIACLAAVLLWRMHRQLKKLNRSLGAVTGKIQEYFSVILEGEEQEEPLETVGSDRFASATRASGERLGAGTGHAPSREERFTYKEDRMLTKEEREMLLSQKKEQKPEDEEVFNAVMKEYFS